MQSYDITNPLKVFREFESQLKNAKALDVEIENRIESYIQNWQQFPKKSFDAVLKDELIKLSIQISQYDTKEAHDLASRVRMISDASLFPPYQNALLKEYCPKYGCSLYTTKDSQIKNLIKDVISQGNLTPSDHFGICMELAQYDAWEAEYLIKNLDALGLDALDVPQRLAVCEQIASYSWRHLERLAYKFEVLPFKKSDADELCAFWSKIVEKGELNASIVAENFDKLGLEGLELPKRLSLIRTIALQGPEASHTLSVNFDKLKLIEEIQACANAQERLTLCKEIAAFSDHTAKALTQNFYDLGFVNEEASTRLKWCYEIAIKSEGTLSAFVKNLNWFGIKECSVSDRYALAEEIIAQGEWGAEILIAAFQKFGLDELEVPERLALSKKILDQGANAAAALALEFDLFCPAEAGLQERLALIYAVASHGDLAAETLAQNIDKLGIDGDSLVEERIALLKELLVQGKEYAAAALAENFDHLGLENEAFNVRYTLVCDIVSQGNPAAASVVVNYEKLGLDGMKESERISLSRKIIAQGNEAADALVEHFDKLSLNKIETSERMSLAQDIASLGEMAAAAMVYNFDKLGLEDVGASVRLALCRKIAAQGDWAAKVLPLYFKELGLEEIGLHERLGLCREIMTAGECAAEALAYHFGLLGFDPRDVTKWRGLCVEIAAQGGMAGTILADKIIGFDIDPTEKRHILLDLLVPPHNLQEDIDYNEITSCIGPLITLLWNKEENLTSDHYNFFEQFLIENKKLRLLLPYYAEMQRDEKTFPQLAQWMAYAAGVLYDLDEDHIQAIEESGILKALFDYRNPQYRYVLVRKLSQFSAEELQTMPKEATEKKWSRLSWLLLNGLKQPGFTDKTLLELLKLINEKTDFKSTTRLNHLAQFLLAVAEEGPYEQEETERIAKTLMDLLDRKAPKKPKKEEAPQQKVIELISNDLQTLTNIIKLFGKAEFFESLSTGKEYDSFFLKKFQNLFKVEEMEGFGERYERTFGSFRNKEAIYVYLNSVNKLPSIVKEKVLQTYSAYVNAVLMGKFHDVRYNAEMSPHLQCLFQNNEGLKEAWVTQEKPGVITQTAVKTPVQMNYKEFFTQKILEDKHLDPNEFPQLSKYLKNQIAFAKRESEPEDPKIQFENLAIALCQEEITVEAFLNKVKTLNMPLGEFQNDLKSLKQQQNIGKYFIYESCDPCDLLMIGTEINGSCQRVDGDPHMNKCLAAYLMNGEIIPIVVKREDRAELAARAVLRLLWDHNNLTPVLLLERVYSNVPDKSIDHAIQRQALLKAEKMGIPLVSKEVGKGEPYNWPVEYLGGFAPFTYSDAAGGVMEGSFNIEGCYVLFDPKQTINQPPKQG